MTEWLALGTTKQILAALKKDIENRREAVASILFHDPIGAVDRGIIREATAVKALEEAVNAIESGDFADEE